MCIQPVSSIWLPPRPMTFTGSTPARIEITAAAIVVLPAPRLPTISRSAPPSIAASASATPRSIERRLGVDRLDLDAGSVDGGQFAQGRGARPDRFDLPGGVGGGEPRCAGGRDGVIGDHDDQSRRHDRTGRVATLHPGQPFDEAGQLAEFGSRDELIVRLRGHRVVGPAHLRGNIVEDAHPLILSRYLVLMTGTYEQLPDGLPVPVDDGAAAHLVGLAMPAIRLPATTGGEIDLAEIARGRSVLFLYPRTGQPGQPLPDGWDDIPGARGCTPETIGFRDLDAQFAAAGVAIYGLSSQDPDYQLELAAAARRRLCDLVRSADATGVGIDVADLQRYRRGPVLPADDAAQRWPDRACLVPGVPAAHPRGGRPRMAIEWQGRELDLAAGSGGRQHR